MTALQLKVHNETQAERNTDRVPALRLVEAPQSGRKLSFEEAVDSTHSRFDGALRRLAR